MKSAKFTYYTGFYFPAYLIFLGVVMVLVSAVLLSKDHVITPLFLLLLSCIFFTSHYGLVIDTEKRRYREYISILGVRQGTEKTYGSISGILLTCSYPSQTMYSFSHHATTVSWKEFDSYLEFGDGHRVHLISRRRKKKLLKKIQCISRDLSVKVLDETPA
jgi:hypothetical protein